MPPKTHIDTITVKDHSEGDYVMIIKGIKIGKNKIYNKKFTDKEVLLWDVQEVKDGEELKLTFISKNSEHKQGVRLAIDVGDGFLEYNGMQSKGFEIWENSSPKEITLKCVTTEGLLSVYNLYDSGRGRRSQAFSSGMVIEEQGNKITYYCNDFGLETNFDKLVFSIEKL
jgi:hypothetical protein